MYVTREWRVTATGDFPYLIIIEFPQCNYITTDNAKVPFVVAGGGEGSKRVVPTEVWILYASVRGRVPHPSSSFGPDLLTATGLGFPPKICICRQTSQISGCK